MPDAATAQSDLALSRNTERRPIGPNDFGLPEDTVVTITLPFVFPPGSLFRNSRTGDVFDSGGMELWLRQQTDAAPGCRHQCIDSFEYLGMPQENSNRP